MGMGPFERWDDWEWEKAAQEVGRERGYQTNWQRHYYPRRTNKSRTRAMLKGWTGLQKRTLLAALLFLTLAISAQNKDPLSKGINSFYQGMMSVDYYAALNGMVKEAFHLSKNTAASMPVDARMSGQLLSPVSGPVMAAFGIVGEDKRKHNGIDVGSALGTPVIAPYAGVVVLSGEDEQLGRIVKLDFGDGWTCVLGNMGDIYVNKGQKINKGEKIGAVGLSAPLKKPWLHFELRYNNKPVDPLPYLANVSKQ